MWSRLCFSSASWLLEYAEKCFVTCFWKLLRLPRRVHGANMQAIIPSDKQGFHHYDLRTDQKCIGRAFMPFLHFSLCFARCWSMCGLSFALLTQETSCIIHQLSTAPSLDEFIRFVTRFSWKFINGRIWWRRAHFKESLYGISCMANWLVRR